MNAGRWRRLAWIGGLGVVAAHMLGGCRQPSSDVPPPDAVAPTRRHVAKSGSLRSLPPHAIGRDAVGPYRLDESLSSVLADLPGGPRLGVLSLPGVADARIARVEEGAILVGGQERSTFIGVVGRDIARTEEGIGVGASLDRVADATDGGSAAAREMAHSSDVARDARLRLIAGLPRWRLLTGREPGSPVIAMVLYEQTPSVAHPSCNWHNQAAAKAAAELPKDAVLSCLTDPGDAVTLAGDNVVQWVFDGGKWRRGAIVTVKDAVLVSPLRTAPHHDDLLVITKVTEPKATQYVAMLWRLDQGRFVRMIGEPIYRIDATNAAAIGASIAELDLLLEATMGEGRVAFGGVLLVRSTAAVRDVAPLLPAYLPLRRRGTDGRPSAPVPPSSDAPSDAAGGSLAGDQAAPSQTPSP